MTRTQTFNKRTLRIEGTQILTVESFIFPIENNASGSVININWEAYPVGDQTRRAPVTLAYKKIDDYMVGGKPAKKVEAAFYNLSGETADLTVNVVHENWFNS